MTCRMCKSDSEFDLCNVCRQKSNYLEKYPVLMKIITPGSCESLRTGYDGHSDRKVDAKCQECGVITTVDLVSILKNLRRNLREDPFSVYKCHPCSKRGKTNISLRNVIKVINHEETYKRFGEIPKNAKKGKVVVNCEDCKAEAEIKLSSLLHGARRHQKFGRSCIYKCFTCGISLPDALEKSYEARAKLLANGARSYLEIALANRLDMLGIKYEEQYRTDMYVWDFLLTDSNTLVDVNGEFWHSFPQNKSKDKSKLTYVSRYLPDFKTLIIEEKSFLNPNMVDRILKEYTGIDSKVIEKDFDFNDIKIEVSDSVTKSKRSDISDFLNSYHYSGFGRNGKYVFSAKIGNHIIAICKYNSITRQGTAKSLGCKCYEVLELDRFCIHPSYHKKNFASWFLSRCIRQIFELNAVIKCLVSFADPTYGHLGTIYKATNWIQKGKTNASYHYMDHLGVPINKKRIYDFANKSEYVNLHNLVKFKEMPKIRYIFKRSLLK